MTRDKVRAAARNVAAYFEIFRSVFGRRETQTHAQVYLKGLLSCLKRKTCESIALGFAKTADDTPCAEKEVVAMQSFITHGKWQVGEAMQKVQAAFAKELVPSCRKWSIGLVGVLVPQIAIVSPLTPRFYYFLGGLPSFPSRLRDVWLSRR